MKKSIGLLIPSLNGGGAERVVSRMSYILNDDYHIFVILFEDTYMKYGAAGTLLNLDVKSVRGKLAKGMLPFRRARKLKQIKRDKKLDFVISFMDSPNLVNLLARYPACKTALSIRNYTEHQFSGLTGKIWNSVKLMLYRRAEFIIPVSRQIEENMVRTYRLPREKMHTIYNPFDLEEIEKLSAQPVEEEFLAFRSTGKTFISVGRRTYQKGFWHLVKAFRMVHEKEQGARLVIIGRDEYDGRLEKLVDEFGLGDCVLLMDFTDNPFKYLGNSDVYVLSSQYEGFPNAMVEAMACGCAVAAADCRSGPREILYQRPDITADCEDTELADYGILTAKLSPDMDWDTGRIDESERKLAQTMLLYAENGALLLEYAQKAKQRAREFGYERFKQAFEDLIGK